MLEIAVCEDNVKYLEFIADSLNALLEEHSVSGAVVLRASSAEQVETFLRDNRANVFFLDIDLSTELSGLDLAAMIHEKQPAAYIVFVSQYANLVFKSFKVRPFDFLPKPVSRDDLKNVILEINEDHLKKIDQEHPDFLQVKIGTQMYRIPKTEILFLEKFGNKCIIHSTSKTVHCYQSLESIFEKLEGADFIRCHKSYIVNKQYISELDLSGMEIRLTNGQRCFVGGKYKKELLSALSKERIR